MKWIHNFVLFCDFLCEVVDPLKFALCLSYDSLTNDFYRNYPLYVFAQRLGCRPFVSKLWSILCHTEPTSVLYSHSLYTVSPTHSRSIVQLWYDLGVLWLSITYLKIVAKPFFSTYANKYRLDLSKKLILSPVDQRVANI